MNLKNINKELMFFTKFNYNIECELLCFCPQESSVFNKIWQCVTNFYYRKNTQIESYSMFSVRQSTNNTCEIIDNYNGHLINGDYYVDFKIPKDILSEEELFYFKLKYC